MKTCDKSKCKKKKIIIIPKFTDKNGMNCVHLREWLSIIILSEINAGWLVRIVWILAYEKKY